MTEPDGVDPYEREKVERVTRMAILLGFSLMRYRYPHSVELEVRGVEPDKDNFDVHARGSVDLIEGFLMGWNTATRRLKRE